VFCSSNITTTAAKNRSVSKRVSFVCGFTLLCCPQEFGKALPNICLKRKAYPISTNHLSTSAHGPSSSHHNTSSFITSSDQLTRFIHSHLMFHSISSKPLYCPKIVHDARELICECCLCRSSLVLCYCCSVHLDDLYFEAPALLCN
jgi:hypothetical protein